MIQASHRAPAGHKAAFRPGMVLLLTWAALAGPAGLLAAAAGRGHANLAAALALAGLVVLAVALFGPVQRSWLQLGAANGVTLLRALLVCLLAAVLGAAAIGDGLAWTLFAVAAAAFLLDGVDGWLARRRGETSDFGARFDMETDAFFLAMLSLLVVDLDKVGPWVLLSGLLRYLFVAAAWLWPWLARPLPPRQRRKAVCALQVAALVACLAPPVSAPAAAWLAAAGLAALVLSFASDILWLHAHAKMGDAS